MLSSATRKSLIVLGIVLISVSTPGWKHSSDPLQEEVRRITQILSSDTFAGRGYHDLGALRAADWIARYMQNYARLFPMFDGNYQQSFTFSVNRILSFSVQAENEAREPVSLQPARDYWIRYPSGSSERDGTILTIRVRECQTLAGGLQENPEKTLRKITNWTQRISQAYRDAWLLFHVHEDPACRDLGEIAHSVIDQLQLPLSGVIFCVGETLPPYHIEVNQLWHTPFLLIRHPAVRSLRRLRVKIVSEYGQVTAVNVGGCWRPPSPEDSFLLVIAHYDHLGKMGSIVFPGAHDNASGTAMILTLARYLRQQGDTFRNNLCFVAMGAEETGLRGSRHFVKKWGTRVWRIRFVLNFDLWGTGEEGVMVVNGKIYPQAYQKLREINRKCGDCVDTLLARGISRRSDHYPFQEQMVPSFFFYTLGGTPGYHTPDDTAGRLSFVAAGPMLRLARLWLHYLDTVPEIPVAYEELFIR